MSQELWMWAKCQVLSTLRMPFGIRATLPVLKKGMLDWRTNITYLPHGFWNSWSLDGPKIWRKKNILAPTALPISNTSPSITHPHSFIHSFIQLTARKQRTANTFQGPKISSSGLYRELTNDAYKIDNAARIQIFLLFFINCIFLVYRKNRAYRTEPLGIPWLEGT